MADRKRKRSAPPAFSPSSSSPRLLPSDAINPLSHPPSTLRQFAVAGLAQTEDLPSALLPGFPHRPLPRRAAPPGDEDAEAEAGPGSGAGGAGGSGGAGGGDAEPAEEEAAAARSRAEKRSAGLEREWRIHEGEVGVVAAILRRSLAEGDLARARVAFGRLARSTVHGKPVDLRHGGYWAMGAEILMRDGEADGGLGGVAGEEGGGAAPRRWGSAANMVRVRAYFEDLIQLHPYNRHHPGSISALDFWPVMLSCEMYNVYIEHKLALEQLEAGVEDLGDAEMGGEQVKYLDSDEQMDGALREGKDKLRLQALDGMRDIASRMDSVMENPPYSTSLEMLRLRGMAALYMGDLALPPHPRTAEEDSEGKARSEEEAGRAKAMFRKLLERGGEIEPWFRHLVQLDDVKGEEEEDEDENGADLMPMYSSLPVRQP